jgi:hypothetical protein
LRLLFLSSCVEQEKVEEFRIKESCIGNVCSLTLVDLSINRSRNIIGKITDHTLSSDNIDIGLNTDITWTIEAGTVADSGRMEELGLEHCTPSCMLNNANPTGVVFNRVGPQTVQVKGTVFDVNKNQRNIDITHHFITKMAEELPSIKYEHTGMNYIFTINLDDLGLLEADPEHKWTIMKGDEEINTSTESNMEFNFGVGIDHGGDYTIIYELIDGNDPSNSLIQTLDINVVDVLQQLTNSLYAEFKGAVTAKGIKNTITATVSDEFKSSHTGATYTWSIKDSEGDSLATEENQGDNVTWDKLAYNNTYTVRVDVLYKDIKAMATADVTTGKMTQASLQADLNKIGITAVPVDNTITANLNNNAELTNFKKNHPEAIYTWKISNTSTEGNFYTVQYGSGPVRWTELDYDVEYKVTLKVSITGIESTADVSVTPTIKDIYLVNGFYTNISAKKIVDELNKYSMYAHAEFKNRNNSVYMNCDEGYYKIDDFDSIYSKLELTHPSKPVKGYAQVTVRVNNRNATSGATVEYSSWGGIQ